MDATAARSGGPTVPARTSRQGQDQVKIGSKPSHAALFPFLLFGR